MTEPTPDLSEAIAANALRPASTTVDGLQVTQRSLSEQIAADKYLQQKQAAGQKSLGAVYRKFVPPGAG